MIVAIDGPAGVGKSTLARRLALVLGLDYVDTGAMYRAVGLAAHRRDIGASDEAAVERLLGEIELELEPTGAEAKILLGGEPVGREIRTQEVGRLASEYAAEPRIRRFLVSLQQDFGHRHGAVMEGRDIGTVVFPDADVKIFLEARPEVRARRRLRDLEAAGQSATFRRVLKEIEARDRRDSERAESPLRYDESYTRIDTSDSTPDEVLAEMVAVVGRVADERRVPSRGQEVPAG